MQLSVERNGAVVIKSERFEDGRWYRIWSDGWLEQGGLLTSGKKNVVFPLPFDSSDYNLLILLDYGDGPTVSWDEVSYAPSLTVSGYGKTTSSFNCGSRNGCWRAEGMKGNV